MPKGEYSDFKAPFINKIQIQEAVDKFRNKYWSNNESPINIEGIIEFELGIQIIPVKNLLNEKAIDAFISNDFRYITIDEDIYMNDSYLGRRRFSLGHEIGHFALHKNLYRKLKFNNSTEWVALIHSIPEREYFFIEQHAYEFSGKLLVPRNQLLSRIQNASVRFKSNSILRSIEDFDMVKSFIFSGIAKEFQVSDGVIERRVNSEQLDLKAIFEL